MVVRLCGEFAAHREVRVVMVSRGSAGENGRIAEEQGFDFPR
ncbi:MAG: hypothetical protein N2508_16900 [Anaerolineae bacterium]|nr:hypothetical protein [Anaerolineae bacterium]